MWLVWEEARSPRLPSSDVSDLVDEGFDPGPGLAWFPSLLVLMLILTIELQTPGLRIRCLYPQCQLTGLACLIFKIEHVGEFASSRMLLLWSCILF